MQKNTLTSLTIGTTLFLMTLPLDSQQSPPADDNLGRIWVGQPKVWDEDALVSMLDKARKFYSSLAPGDPDSGFQGAISELHQDVRDRQVAVDVADALRAALATQFPDFAPTLQSPEAASAQSAAIQSLTPPPADLTPKLAFQEFLTAQKEIVDGLATLRLRIQRDDASALGKQLLLLEFSTTVDPRIAKAQSQLTAERSSRRSKAPVAVPQRKRYAAKVRLQLSYCDHCVHLEFPEVSLKDIQEFVYSDGQRTDRYSVDDLEFRFFWEDNPSQQSVRKENGTWIYSPVWQSSADRRPVGSRSLLLRYVDRARENEGEWWYIGKHSSGLPLQAVVLRDGLRVASISDPPRAYELYPQRASQRILVREGTAQSSQRGADLKFLGFGVSRSRLQQNEELGTFSSMSPLISGLGQGTDTFGWIIGVREGEDSIQPGTYVTYALVEVPEDSRGLVLTQTGSWIDVETGREQPADSPCVSAECSYSLPIPALLARQYLNPRIDQVYGTEYLGQGATLVVDGHNFAPGAIVVVNGRSFGSGSSESGEGARVEVLSRKLILVHVDQETGKNLTSPFRVQVITGHDASPLFVLTGSSDA